MGIKHFWMWWRTNFGQNITSLKKNDCMDEHVDNFMIDMNGIFHNSAQRVFEYGNCKPPKLLLFPERNIDRHIPTTYKNHVRLFVDICEQVDKLFKIAKPKKRLVLCVDGPAPISKQTQQRGRRFRSAMETQTTAMDTVFNAVV